jgi:WD40 repeat protein
MSYCLNPHCQNPENPADIKFCQSCGTELQLNDRYRALSLLGEGGFGRTFIAEDADRLNATCVIKQFLPLPQVQQNSELLETATKMFAQEAQRLLQLGDHPQIPTLFADFAIDGRLYLVQQFINGKTLLQELDENGPFSSDKIKNLLLDLLPVLQYIHDRNVVHRDIKPENILRQKSDGKYVLIDFGVAKQLSSNVLVKTGTKIGTEGYAPIEQLRGGKAYPASDLYSLGVTCIHLMTDTNPDELYDPMKGRWLWREELIKKGITIDRRLEKVIDKMVQEWVSDRYESARVALADLYWSIPQRFMSKSPTSSTGTPTINSSIPTTWKCVHTLTGHQNYAIAVAISPDGETLASCSYDKTIKVWHLATGNAIGTLTAHTGWVSCLAISPDGQILVSGSLDNSLKLWDLGSGNLLQTWDGLNAYPLSIAISPDGGILAAGCFDSTVKLWDLTTGMAVGTLTGHTGYVESVAIAPDGKTLASGGGYDDHTIKLWDLSSGLEQTTLQGHLASVRAVAFTPNSQQLVSGSEDKTVKLWDLQTQTETYSLQTVKDWVQAVAVSPDGEIIACGSRDRLIRLFHLRTGQELCTLKWHSGPITSVAFSPEGNKLVSSSWDHTIKIWQAVLSTENQT